MLNLRRKVLSLARTRRSLRALSCAAYPRGPLGPAAGAGTVRYAPAAALESRRDCLAVDAPAARAPPVRLSLGTGVPPIGDDARETARPVLRVMHPTHRKFSSLSPLCVRRQGGLRLPLASSASVIHFYPSFSAPFLLGNHHLSYSRLAWCSFMQFPTVLFSLMNNPG